jgi:hypothetical protein
LSTLFQVHNLHHDHYDHKHYNQNQNPHHHHHPHQHDIIFIIISHCTENSNYIILEMRLRGLVPVSTFMYLGAIYIFPPSDLFGISIFLYFMRDLLAQLQEQAGRELPPSRGWQQFPALPSAPAVESRVHLNDQNKNL